MEGGEGVVGFAEEVGEEEGISGKDFVGALAWSLLLLLLSLGLYGGRSEYYRHTIDDDSKALLAH